MAIVPGFGEVGDSLRKVDITVSSGFIGRSSVTAGGVGEGATAGGSIGGSSVTAGGNGEGATARVVGI